MKVVKRVEEQICVVTVEAQRIDAQVALEFKEIMRRETADVPRFVLLDLGAVDFVDSSGLGALVATLKHLAPDRSLALAAVRPPVAKVFALTRMDSVFQIYDTVEDALRAEMV